MKAAGVVVALAIAGALLYWFALRSAPTPAPSKPAPVAAGSGSVAQPEPPDDKPPPVSKVRRITKEERAALAEQIARARSDRKLANDPQMVSGQPPRERPTLEAGSDEQIVKTTMKAAMQEVIPMLADCYDKGGSALPKQLEVVAKLKLTGDPDIGTIVDANSLENKDGTPVNAAFEACVRDTLVTLEMPPLSEGGEVSVTYPFMFASDDSTMPP